MAIVSFFGYEQNNRLTSYPMGMVPSVQTTSKMGNRFSAPARAKQIGVGLGTPVLRAGASELFGNPREELSRERQTLFPY